MFKFLEHNLLGMLVSLYYHPWCPPTPKQKFTYYEKGPVLAFRLVLLWKNFYTIMFITLVPSFQWIFTKLLVHLICVNIGSVLILAKKERLKMLFYYIPWKLLSQILYWRILVHMAVDLWLSIGGDLLLLTLKGINSRIYWHIL